MKLNITKKYQIYAVVATLPFFVWLYRYINADFYYDEVFTLIHYVLVPLKNTIAIYKDINNHFLSNLINNIYLKLISEESLYSLMDHPWVIRIVQLVYTIITLSIFYHLCRKFFNRHIALLSIILLTTSIPFYNYALQVRGYNISITLLCIFLYFLWNFEQHYRLKDGVLLAVSCALLIYSLLSNLYTLLGIMIFYSLEGLISYILMLSKNKIKSAKQKKMQLEPQLTFIRKNREIVILSILGCGIILSIILYSPLLKGLLNDQNLARQNEYFYMPILFEIMPSVFHAFLSWRYLVALLSISGFIFLLVNYKKYDKEYIRKTLFCIVVIVIPVMTSFIRGDKPWDRFFLNQIPLFCLLLSLCLYFLLRNIIEKSKIPYIAAALFLYTNTTFYFGVKHINDKLLNDIKTETMSVSLLYNYWQAHYAPLKLLQFFTQNYRLPKYNDRCVFLLVEKCDRAATPAYLNKFTEEFSDPTEWVWTFTSAENWKKFTGIYDSIYVFTAYPYEFKRGFLYHFPDFEIKRLNERLQFQNIFLVTKKKH